MPFTILIVDDDAQLRQSFARLLTQEGYRIRTAATGEAGVVAAKTEPPDLVIMDVRLPGMDGLEAFTAIHQHEPRLPVIIMTAFAATDVAIKATRLGAFDFVVKPFEIPEMLNLIKQALEAGRFMRSRVELDRDPAAGAEDSDAIIGRSRPMQEIYKAIGRVAPTGATVLIRGESGTGKELAARALYQHSLRAEMPFVVINCVAIPETLLESELFGYEKGAFTGAQHRRVGKIEQANSGTIFLDEIGDMPQSIQAKVLRLLQEKSIERLGGREVIPVDVRIIAATNRNLEQSLADGRFREDLYYRLNVVTLWLPQLRERREDIPLLADYFLNRHARRLNLNNPGISPPAQKILADYPWPGNVRELANLLENALIFSRGRPINTEAVMSLLSTAPAATEAGGEEAMRQFLRQMLLGDHDRRDGQGVFGAAMDKVSGLLIAEALTITGGNRTKAAEILGLSRPTLLAKMDKLKLRTETSVKSE